MEISHSTTTSVCMGTYNGEKYIRQQLLCILGQTQQPDEVILCDDGSTDATCDIIEDFIQKNCLEDTWKLYQNKENKGYPRNFYYAMDLCTKDIVFLADQDDIWDERKIELMSRALEQYKEATVVCCKFGLVDAAGEDIHSLMQPTRSAETNKVRAVTIDDVFYKCEWPGMVLAYRREWYQEQMGESEGYRIPHDILICTWAAEHDRFIQMDTELAWHRRHENNAGGEEHRISRLLNRERKLSEIRKYNDMLLQFLKGEVLRTEKGKQSLNRKYKTMQSRYEALLSGKMGRVLLAALKNNKNIRLATVICDVILCIKK